MLRILQKRYLLRFKGVGIFSHTVFIAVVFALVAAVVTYRIQGGEPAKTTGIIVAAALIIAAGSFLPLRFMYRIIQRQPLFRAVPVALSVAGLSAFLLTLALVSYRPGRLVSLLPWPPDQSVIPAIEVAVITVVGYALVIQLAVSARRERMARRRSMSNRLKVLQARIRPHFFFNTLNSVASLIRSDPDAAEKAIEDLADVFRVVIRSDRKLVSLAEEIEIAKQYMNIEKLRLGERLNVEWHTTDEVLNMNIPSLTLQPLLENAVYHGIEPSMAGGTITIDCSCEDERLHILITNPVAEVRSEREGGNQVALKNIKERLMRQFGGDVKINIRSTRDRFNVSIDAPLVRHKPTK